MSKFEYTEDMVTRMHDVAGSGVTEEIIESLMDEFDFPRRSVTAKLRKLGYDVPKKPGAWTKFARRVPFLKYLKFRIFFVYSFFHLSTIHH